MNVNLPSLSYAHHPTQNAYQPITLTGMRHSGYNVLIIDDNNSEITLLERFLLRSCVPIRELKVARTAQEGIEKIRDERPDFIIIGDAYPDMSRSELLKQLSEIISLETLPTICLVNDDATATSELLITKKIGVIRKAMLSPEKLGNVMQSLLEQARMRVERNRAEAISTLLFEHSNDAIALTNAEGVLVAANKNYLNLFQLDSTSIGRQVQFTEDNPFHSAAHGSISKVYQNDKHGNRIELEVKRLFIEEHGKRSFMLSIYKAVKTDEQVHSATSDTSALAGEARWLREFESAYKNALHTLQMIFRLKIKGLPKERYEQLLQEHNRQMRLVVAASECVSVCDWRLKVSTAQYVANIFDIFEESPLMREGVEMKYEGETLWIEFSEAIFIGLILGELITNALQHAFTELGGLISVAFTKEKDDAICMTVSDSGVGIPVRVETKPPDAMGLAIVRSLTKRLNGKMEVKRYMGTIVRIVFPQKAQQLEKESKALVTSEHST